MPFKSKWNEEQKREAVAIWLCNGNARLASEQTGIPKSTIQSWKRIQPEWFNKVAEEIWGAVEDRMKSRYNQINDLATAALIDRLKNGDTKVLSNGQKVMQPVAARDLIIIAGTSQDKVRVIQGKTQTLTTAGAETAGSVLEQLKADIAKRIEAQKNDPDSNIRAIQPKLISKD